MKFFVALLDTENRGISVRARQRVESVAIQRGMARRWSSSPGMAVLTAWDSDGGDTLIESDSDCMAVGHVRLDNRSEIVEQIAGRDGDTDLALALRVVAQHGTKSIRGLLGDFAFVVWNTVTRTAMAACDAFGVRPLFYARWDGLMVIGSRAEPVAGSPEYERRYLADIIAMDTASRDLTAYAGVRRLPPAHIISVHSRTFDLKRYWSAVEFEPTTARSMSEAEAIATCRDLLVSSIRLRLDPGGRSWAQLSGGLDSSSVVSLVQWLSEQGVIANGLAGTVTFVEGSGTGGDEREYANAVVRRWQVPNEQIVDPPMWVDPECPVPHMLDHPFRALALDPRDRRFCSMLRDHGARVLLTGWGSDQLFTGDMVYFADRVTGGDIAGVFGELAHIAALGRMPFWTLAKEYVIVPLLPRTVQQRALRKVYSLPSWLQLDTLQKLGVPLDIPDPRGAGRVGHKYFDYLAMQAVYLDRQDDWEAASEVLSVRHPFLYRPLVEFALALPPEMCTRPHARKWVFRQAMKGLLPDVVSARVGKGGGSDTVPRMFVEQRALFRQIAREPILADLGLIEARSFQAAIARATSERQHDKDNRDVGHAMRTLSVEAWLQIRSGRWPHGFRVDRVPVRELQTTS